MTVQETPTHHREAEPPGPTPRRRRRRIWLRRTVIVLAVLMVLPTISFVRALTYPGNAPLSVKAVEWVRDNGGGGLVNTIENWVYSRNQPAATGTPKDLAVPSWTTPATAPASVTLPRIRLITNGPAIRGEGTWHQAGSSASHRPTLFTSWFRPDAAHTSVVAGAALIPRAGTTLHLAGGTREPVPDLQWPGGFRVPTADRQDLVATFNAGWKLKDIAGGWRADGRTPIPLVKGAASVVIFRDGHAEVGAWSDAWAASPDVVAVRQNLAMVLQNGRPTGDLTANRDDRWGSTKNQLQYTSRSGIGTDAAGDLIYVAGRNLTLDTLAQAMQRAGIRNGMELDIHNSMVTFNVYDPSARSSPGHKLLPSMLSPADRYLTADQRDFFYVTAR